MPSPDDAAALPWSLPYRLADLPARKPTRFRLAPDEAVCAAIAAELDILTLSKLTFDGELRPAGRHDWELEARLGATVTQACVVTLDPVQTRIEEPVFRRYLADMADPTEDEAQMPEDDTAEPIGAIVDAGAVMVEALALALPAYPRADGAAFAATAVTEPGADALTDEDLKPFAGLAGLLQGTDKSDKGDA